MIVMMRVERLIQTEGVPCASLVDLARELVVHEELLAAAFDLKATAAVEIWGALRVEKRLLYCCVVALRDGAALVVMVVIVLMPLVHVGLLHTPVLSLLSAGLIVPTRVEGGRLVVRVVLIVCTAMRARLLVSPELTDCVLGMRRVRHMVVRVTVCRGSSPASLDLIVVVGDVIEDKLIAIKVAVNKTWRGIEIEDCLWGLLRRCLLVVLVIDWGFGSWWELAL